jgi:hypothetical protein
MSSSPGQLLPASAFTYSISLRARHPQVNLSVLTETLRLDPAYSWTAGEPRNSQASGLSSGHHRDSYWSAPLPGQLLGEISMPLETFLGQQLVQLGRHRQLFSRLQADGGEISLLIELSPVASASLNFSSAMARKLADLNFEVEFQFLGE